MNLEEDISISELSEIEKMSVRSINVCYKAGVNSLFDLIKFHLSGKLFSSIRNCGKASEEELIGIYRKYESIYRSRNFNLETNNKPLLTINRTIETYLSLSQPQKDAVDKYLQYLIIKLTVRSRNAILSLTLGKTESNVVVPLIFKNEFSFYKLKNIGETSAVELKKLKTNLSTFIESIKKLEPAELGKQFLKLLILGKHPSLIEGNFENIFDENGKLQLFKLIDLLITLKALFNSKEERIFTLLYTKENNTTLKDVAEDLDISLERVRQIKVDLENNIRTHFEFIISLQLEDITNYGIERDQYFGIIDEHLVSTINQKENTNFNCEFCAIIYSLLLLNTHNLFRVVETANNKIKLSKIYLIRNDLFFLLNFSAFLSELHDIVNEKRTKDHFLFLDGLIIKHCGKIPGEKKHLLNQIGVQIIYHEYCLPVNKDGYIRIERNKKKAISDYLISVLNLLNEPSTVTKIAEAVRKKYPDVSISETSIRATLQREKQYFIPFSRTSTYGLKRWETERANLKGGSLRNIAEEFLLLENDPKHISDIVKYISQYRKTSKLNLLTNLQLDQSKRFVFFPGEFVGLRSKNYESVQKYKRPVGAYFSKSILEKMKGWSFDNIVNYYVEKYDYNPIQVRSILEEKILRGKLTLTNTNEIDFR